MYFSYNLGNFSKIHESGFGAGDTVASKLYYGELIGIKVTDTASYRIYYCYNAGVFQSVTTIINAGVTDTAYYNENEGTYFYSIQKRNKDKWVNRNESDFKLDVYSLADILAKNNLYAFCTTSPVEESLGFKGYGILWWQLENYYRKTFYVGAYYTKDGTRKYKTINGGHEVTLNIGSKNIGLDDTKNKSTLSNNNINTEFHSWTMVLKAGSYNLSASATGYGNSTYNSYNINKESSEKIVALFPMNVESKKLSLSGGKTWANWNTYTSVLVPRTWRYNAVALQEWSVIESEWNKEDYYSMVLPEAGSTKTKNSEFGSEIGKAMVRLKGKADITYTYKYTKKGKRYKNLLGIDCLKKGNDDLGTGEKTETISVNSACIVHFPVQSLKEATKGEDFEYNPETCTITKAAVKIKLECYVNDNGLTKLDFSGLVGKDIKENERYPLHDNVTCWAKFGNAGSGTKVQNVQYSLYSNKANSIKYEIPLDLNDVSSELKTSSEEPKDLQVYVSWDAKIVGMNFNISIESFEVEYSFGEGNANDKAYIWEFYDPNVSEYSYTPQ